MSRQSTAFHEAGHAAAGLIYGFPLPRASIVQDEDSLGHVLNLWGEPCNTQSPAACSQCSRPTCLPIQETPEGAQYVIAGVCADALHEQVLGDDEPVIRRASEDLLHGSGRGDARSLSASLFENDGVGDLMRDTIRLLRDNWPLVESLVAALLSHGTLSQDQLTAIYSDFRDSPT